MSPDSSKGQVIVFKAPTNSEKEQNDIYHDLLSENGFQVINVPVLDFEFVNLDQLLCKLNKPEDYSGIILSSPRCVKGCKLAADKGLDPDKILEKWKGPNFAVGEATAKLAQEIGLNTLGKESGNANALADVISKDKYEKPFLYPIGSLTNDNFKQKLKEFNIEVDDISIYKTKPHPELESNLRKLSNELVDPVYFLYFSPSGVNFTLPIMRDLNFKMDSIKFVAIGPTTEKGLKDNGLDVYRTVPKPTPAATLETLTS